MTQSQVELSLFQLLIYLLPSDANLAVKFIPLIIRQVVGLILFQEFGQEVLERLVVFFFDLIMLLEVSLFYLFKLSFLGLLDFLQARNRSGLPIILRETHLCLEI